MKNRLIQFTTVELNEAIPLVKDARLFVNGFHRQQTGAPVIIPHYGNQMRIKNTAGVDIGVTVLSGKEELAAYQATNRYVDILFPDVKAGADATGLANDATVYTARASLSTLAIQAISIVGSAAQTITDLVTELNADLTGATATYTEGDNFIRITADATTVWMADIWDSGANKLMEALGANANPEAFGLFVIYAGETRLVERVGRPYSIMARKLTGAATSPVNIELQAFSQ